MSSVVLLLLGLLANLFRFFLFGLFLRSSFRFSFNFWLLGRGGGGLLLLFFWSFFFSGGFGLGWLLWLRGLSSRLWLGWLGVFLVFFRLLRLGGGILSMGWVVWQLGEGLIIFDDERAIIVFVIVLV